MITKRLLIENNGVSFVDLEGRARVKVLTLVTGRNLVEGDMVQYRYAMVLHYRYFERNNCFLCSSIVFVPIFKECF